MVPALRVQRAVHQQVGVMRLQRFALFLGLLRHHRRAQHQVGADHGLLAVVKGQHVGGVIFFAVITVQGLAFFGVHDAHGDFSIALQGVANPAGHLVTRQSGAVQGGVVQLAKLQGQSEFIEHQHGMRSWLPGGLGRRGG